MTTPNSVIDPHRSSKKYFNWKAKGALLNVNSKVNVEPIRQHILDLELGRNTSKNKKGGRSFKRLNGLRSRLPTIANLIQQHYGKSITEVTQDEITELIHKLETGEILSSKGQPYLSWTDFGKDFKSFWHWWMKVNKRQGIIIEDITEDLNITSNRTPHFIYFSYEELLKMMEKATPKYKAMMIFMFDTCIRAPSELSNVKVSDIKVDENDPSLLWINIRKETSKTKTGDRKFKLMLSSSQIKNYINENNLSSNDALFKVTPRVINQYIKRLAKKTIGKEPTMYDFRHCGICYWKPRYKHESALRYRTGHKDSKMLDYYSQFLGMTDTIEEEDLVDATRKVKIEKELEQEKKHRQLLQEQVDHLVMTTEKHMQEHNSKLKFLLACLVNAENKEEKNQSIDELWQMLNGKQSTDESHYEFFNKKTK